MTADKNKLPSNPWGSLAAYAKSPLLDLVIGSSWGAAVKSARQRIALSPVRASRRFAELSRRQIALYEIHAGDAGFQMINGFACHCSLDERSSVPVTLITEYPDETIYGDALVAGYKAQAATVIAAYDAWQVCAP